MSARQFFTEVEAVCEVLDGFVQEFDILDGQLTAMVSVDEEIGTAIWQAVELLSRAYSALLPAVQAQMYREQAEANLRAALDLPDVQESDG